MQIKTKSIFYFAMNLLFCLILSHLINLIFAEVCFSKDSVQPDDRGPSAFVKLVKDLKPGTLWKTTRFSALPGLANSSESDSTLHFTENKMEVTVDLIEGTIFMFSIWVNGENWADEIIVKLNTLFGVEPTDKVTIVEDPSTRRIVSTEAEFKWELKGIGEPSYTMKVNRSVVKYSADKLVEKKTDPYTYQYVDEHYKYKIDSFSVHGSGLAKDVYERLKKKAK